MASARDGTPIAVQKPGDDKAFVTEFEPIVSTA